MREEVYDISGMHCAACSASVEKVTRRLPGVERSDVNLVAERMTIVYDETQVTPEQIIAKVEKAGFGAKLHQDKPEAAPVSAEEDPEEAELRRKKRELIVSAISRRCCCMCPWVRCSPSVCPACRCRICFPCTRTP